MLSHYLKNHIGQFWNDVICEQPLTEWEADVEKDSLSQFHIQTHLIIISEKSFKSHQKLPSLSIDFHFYWTHLQLYLWWSHHVAVSGLSRLPTSKLNSNCPAGPILTELHNDRRDYQLSSRRSTTTTDHQHCKDKRSSIGRLVTRKIFSRNLHEFSSPNISLLHQCAVTKLL